MLLKNPLDHILGQASKVHILRFLIRTDAEFNGREIASAVGISHVNAHTALKKLSQHGVVVMRRGGRSILYRLNSNSVLVKKLLLPLFENEARLSKTLEETLSKHLKRPSPGSVILFGSFASGTAESDSDIDLLVVAREKKDIPLLSRRLEKVEISITAGFGNHLAAIVMDALEFKRKYRNGDRFIRNITKEATVLFGDSMNDLIQSNG